MTAQDRVPLGILCMLGFCVLAPVMDAFAKATPEEVPVTQIVAARFAIQAILLLPLAAALGHGRLPGPRDTGLNLLRAGALLTATGCFFAAIRHMPIANALAIFFVEPFILSLLGALVLRETVGWRRIAACTVGFAGALLVIRPSFDDLGAVALLPLGTAFFFALYMLLTRAMSRRISPVALQAQTALAASLLILPPLVLMEGSGAALWDPVLPTGGALVTLAGVGILATASHLSITYALRFAPAGTIAPLQYLEIVGAVAVGYIAFADFPDALTWVGIAIIVGSGLYVFARERQLGKRAERPPPPP